MKFINYCSMCLVYVACVATSILAEEVCVMKTPCKCEFPNGTGIDLTPAAKSTFYETPVFKSTNTGAEIDLITYMYHPCTDALPTIDGKVTTNNCNKQLQLCRQTTSLVRNGTSAVDYMVQNATCEDLGSSDITTIRSDGRAIVYSHLPSINTVLLVCAETDGDLRVLSLTEPNQIVLQFFTKYACMEQLEEPGRSVGSTLCIVFFSFVILYLVLGVCTKKFLMGATGLEVIPNLGFWTDLPNLIKDGWAFALNGFKLPMRSGAPATSPDPNSYDSI